MARSAPEPNGPEDVDAAFAEIIADLEKEGLSDASDGPGGRASHETDSVDENSAQDDGRHQEYRTHASDWRVSDTEWDWAEATETEHYVPPEPPPLPRLRAGTVLALVLAAVGIFLLVAPGVIGLRVQISAPLALVLLAGSLGLLMLRMRSGPPPGSDDGAQL